jgi:hypothetical protein
MRTQTQLLLAVAALLGGAAAPARGQDAAIDPRWLAYVGCWERVGDAKANVCVVPTDDRSAVELVTVLKGEVTARERIVASGARVQTTRGDCRSWSTAQWSSRGQRLYMRSEETCPGTTAAGTGVIAMSDNGQWLYVQGMTLGGQTGVRVERFREATSELLLPDDVATAVRRGISAAMQARAAASTPLMIEDVVDATRNVDVAVLEAWLVERRERFTLDAKRLVALADAGVPSRVVDVMVALSYPKAFAINAASRQGERLGPSNASGPGTASGNYLAPYDPFCYDAYSMYPYSTYDCSGIGYRYRYGFGYGYDWYRGDHPVTIIYSGSSGGTGSRPHGRVVNGQGYKTGDDTGPTARPRPSDTGPRAASGSSSGSPGAAAPSSSSSSGSSERTAQPRRP